MSSRGPIFVTAAVGGLLLAAICLLLPYLATIAGQGAWIGLDYWTFYGAGGLLVEGQDPYAPTLLDARIASLGLARNPGDVPGCMPGWLLVHAAFAAAASPWRAFTLWSALNWLAHTAAVLLTARAVGAPRCGATLAALLLPAALGSTFIGQSSSLVALALAVGMVGGRGVGPPAAAIATAATVKVTPLGWLLGWIAVPTAPTLVLAVAATIGLQLPALAWRPGIWGEFLAGASRMGTWATPPNAAILANQSLRGFALRLAEALGVAPWLGVLGWMLASVALVGAAAFRLRRAAAPEAEPRRALALAACTILLVSPYSWHHTYGILVAPLLWALHERPWVGRAAWVLIAAQFVFDHAAPPGAWGRFVACPAMLAAGILAVEQVRHLPPRR